LLFGTTLPPQASGAKAFSLRLYYNIDSRIVNSRAHGLFAEARRNVVPYRKVEKIQNKREAASLNIKDPEAHRLAQAIAQETGETITRVVTGALRERYERLQSRKAKVSVEELRAIAKRAAAHVKGPYLDHAELLYDNRGLPK
jgi:antitoxin VapB